uniref:T-complex protein 1 subunit gamma n=1 Tax=Arundo donax TaxID=35708 RepID=A0A0A9E8M0_ARUDO
MPTQAFSPLACFPWSCVIVLITFKPQFWANVLGIASNAKAAAS